jgi:hypothetical protein
MCGLVVVEVGCWGRDKFGLLAGGRMRGYPPFCLERRDVVWLIELIDGGENGGGQNGPKF